MSANDQPTAQMTKSAFVMTWIVAGAVTFGLMGGIFVSALCWVDILYWNWVPALAPVIGGSVGGLIQWSVLRKWIPRCGWWIPASAAGAFVGLTLAVPIWAILTFILIGAFLPEGMDGWDFSFLELIPDFALYVMIAALFTLIIAIPGAAGGFVGGLLQWLVLWRSVPRSGRWIGISMLGWAIAGTVACFWFGVLLTLLPEFRVGFVVENIIASVTSTIAGALGGAASGAISGRYLTRLLPDDAWAPGRIRGA